MSLCQLQAKINEDSSMHTEQFTHAMK